MEFSILACFYRWELQTKRCWRRRNRRNRRWVSINQYSVISEVMLKWKKKWKMANSKKNWVFQLRQFSIFFHQNFRIRGRGRYNLPWERGICYLWRRWWRWANMERSFGLYRKSRYSYMGPHYLCWILGLAPFNVWFISNWEENKCCDKPSKCTKWYPFHSKWSKLSFWVKIVVILSIPQLFFLSLRY